MAAEETINPVAPKAAAAGLDSIVESVKGHWYGFDLKAWTQKVGGDSALALEAAIYFVGSFFFGFLFKKYFSYVLLSIVITVGILLFMQHNQMISINHETMRSFFGLNPHTDVSSLIGMLIEWIKNNVLLSVAVLVGFVLGFKLG